MVGVGPTARSLALRVGPDQPLYGLFPEDALEPAVLESLDAPFKVEDVSAILIKSLHQVQPHGPYFLCGLGYYAAIAYEMARQLRASGEEVRLVAMIEPSGLPRPYSQMKRVDGSSRFARLGQKAGFILQRLREGGLLYFVERVKIKLKGLRIWVNLSHYNLRLRLGVPVRGRLRDVRYVLYFSLLNFQPLPYDGRVAVLRCAPSPGKSPSLSILGKAACSGTPAGTTRSGSQISPGARSDYRCEALPRELYGKDAALGWDGLVSGSLDVQYLPIEFDFIFREPEVEITAAKLRELLLQDLKKSERINDLEAAGKRFVVQMESRCLGAFRAVRQLCRTTKFNVPALRIMH